MKTIVSSIRNFMKDEEGLTTVEYAVAGTLIALAVVVAFRNLGDTVNNSISEINSELNVD
jgi:pilus assembly protein Flp/PilA